MAAPDLSDFFRHKDFSPTQAKLIQDAMRHQFEILEQMARPMLLFVDGEGDMGPMGPPGQTKS